MPQSDRFSHHANELYLLGGFERLIRMPRLFGTEPCVKGDDSRYTLEDLG